MENMNLFIPITKVDVAQRLVYGTLTEETPDKSGEIFDYESGKEAFNTWSSEFEKATNGNSVGNLRAMHGDVAAGKFTSISFDDVAKKVYGVAKVIDDVEWNKVIEGVYTGYSIGGKYAKRWPDADNPKLTRFTPVLSEVSLVDNPCVPTATFEVIKSDGSTEIKKFHSTTQKHEAPMHVADNITPEIKQGWQAKDGTFFLTKAEAVKHNTQQETLAKASPALEALKNLETAVTKAEGEPEVVVEEVVVVSEEPKADEPAVEPQPEPEAPKADEPVVDADAPAVDAEKAVKAPTLKKGMYDVARLASIIDDLTWLQSSIEWEAEAEGDGSTAPSELQTHISSLCVFLQSYVSEETQEIMADDSDKSASSKDDLAKAVDERDALQKVLSDITPTLAALQKRIEQIEKLPASPKGVRRAISKAEDNSFDVVSDTVVVENFHKHLEKLSPEEKALALMKVSLASPVVRK